MEVSLSGSAVRKAAAAVAAAGLLLLAGVLALSSWTPPAEPLPVSRRLRDSNQFLPSLYLNYQQLPTTDKKSWFSTIDVTDSGAASFFAVQRSQFGYLGIQQTYTFMGGLAHGLGTRLSTAMGDEWKGLVIFSAWDTDGADCYTESVGEGFTTKSFSGEGTGCKITGDVKWGADSYDFLTTTEMMANGRLKLTGYWNDRGSGWALVGSISVLPQGRKYGEGGFAAFIEQYDRTRDMDDLRMANYGPQFVETSDAVWTPISQAQFDLTETDKTAYYVAATNADSSEFVMGVQGMAPTGSDGFDGDTPAGTVLTLRNPGVASTNAELQAFISERNQGTLPQGCTGAKSCGSALPNPSSLVPDNALEGLLWVLIASFLSAAGYTLFNCCSPTGSSEIYMEPLSGQKDSRQLRRLAN